MTDLEKSTTLLKQAYAAFNARDMEGALSTMRADVEWSNGMEGGTVHGHEGVREYWTRQWGMINPHVDPASFELDSSANVVVGVRQVVRDRSGKILLDRMVQNAQSAKAGLIH